MRKSQSLALSSILACAIFLAATPSYAQKRIPNSIQSAPTAQQQNTVVRDHRNDGSSNPRDHRGNSNASGGVTVTSSGGKRNSNPCIKSVLGGPCVGGDIGKGAKAATEFANQYTPNSGAQGVYDAYKGFTASDPNRDHRTK